MQKKGQQRTRRTRCGPSCGLLGEDHGGKPLLVMDRREVGLREDAHPYLKLRYCRDFISLEKPSKVSIWLSRRCRVVKLLRFSRPSTFFSRF